MTEMTAIVKVLKKSAAIFLTMTLLMSGFSLNVVNAADKGRSSGGSLSANGSQTKDEGQTADKNQAAGRNQTAGKSQAEIDAGTFEMSMPEESAGIICSEVSIPETGPGGLCAQTSSQRKMASGLF